MVGRGTSTRRVAAALVGLSASAVAAAAEPISGDAARGQLYEVGTAEVQFLKGSPLSEDQARLMALALAQQPFFGAVAISPDEKLLESKATMAVANYHSSEAAAKVALRECEKLRTGATPCAVVAFIRPKGWKKGSLALSADATAGFQRSYPEAEGALAISPSSGAWGIAKGAGAGDSAVKACGASADVGDCAVVVAD